MNNKDNNTRSHNHSCCMHEEHHKHHHTSKGAPQKGGKYDKVPEGYTGTVYTCPMHPEVRSPGPGSCPLCGMGLEPETVTAVDEGPNPELVDFNKRFWVGVLLTVPLLVLSMSPILASTKFGIFLVNAQLFGWNSFSERQ